MNSYYIYLTKILEFLYDKGYHILFTVLFLAIVYPGHGLGVADESDEESISEEGTDTLDDLTQSQLAAYYK